MSNGKDMITPLIAGLIKKTFIKMSQYFPSYKSFKENVRVELDLKNYVTKNDVKNISHVDASSFAIKSNLASLKTKVDKLDIDKSTPVLMI